jgi:hypothetical protein
LKWPRFLAGSEVVGPSAVGDGGLRVEPQAGFGGAGGQCPGDLLPAVAVGAGVVDVLRQFPFGLVDEAGDQGDAGSGANRREANGYAWCGRSGEFYGVGFMS